MGALTLSPKEIRRRFSAEAKRAGSRAATDWFYGYCVKNDYVKKSKLDKNPRFEENGLVITINKAKPEFRDPKKAASGNSVKGGYPKCAICRENEGCRAQQAHTAHRRFDPRRRKMVLAVFCHTATFISTA